MLNTFVQKKIIADTCIIDLLIAGKGPGLLLLHGFPETKLTWHKIAPQLAGYYTVVVPDLPGYGDSTGPTPDEKHENYSKRKAGNILAEVMRKLNFQSYAVAGHDRGARVAYRMALDHSSKITQLAVLDIIPTLEMAERLDYESALEMENWFFLSQPKPLPETLIGANPEFYLNYILDNWAAKPEMISPEIRKEYLRCFKNPKVIEAMCEEYRATYLDIIYDREDRLSDKRIDCPVLVLWSENDLAARFGDSLAIWKGWANNVRGTAVQCGHFLMEECPAVVLNQFLNFFERK